MNITNWNGVSAAIAIGRAWNGYATPPIPLPPLPTPTPTPPPLRLRESTRRVGVENTTARRRALVTNYGARVFFEYTGISGLNKINPDDVHCPGFKLGKDPV